LSKTLQLILEVFIHVGCPGRLDLLRGKIQSLNFGREFLLPQILSLVVAGVERLRQHLFILQPILIIVFAFVRYCSWLPLKTLLLVHMVMNELALVFHLLLESLLIKTLSLKVFFHY
tara:strand:- start:29 stop:379 length:351 start_codon:yes stop_codon:yes gene_type:complete